MLTEYIVEAMSQAQYKILEDGTYFGEVPGFQGVWGNADTLEACRKELQEVLEEWLVLKLWDNEEVPQLAGITLAKRSS
jgi:predicted RNase H-like HicB family nuclease